MSENAEKLARAFPDVQWTWPDPDNGTLADITWHDTKPGTDAEIQAAIDAEPTTEELVAAAEAEPDPTDELKAVVLDLIEAQPPTVNKAALRTKLDAIKDRKPKGQRK